MKNSSSNSSPISGLENLEKRFVPTVSSLGLNPLTGILAINANDTPTTIRVDYLVTGSGAARIEQVRVIEGANHVIGTFLSPLVRQIRFTGGGAMDNFNASPFRGPIRADGGLGDDYLFGGNSSNTLLGGEGNDYLQGGGTGNYLGQGGNDRIITGPGNDVIEGGDGNDIIASNGGRDNIHGGTGDDTISGGEELDWIQGDEGNDNIRGDGGNDLLRGGEGNDTINGGLGDDTIDGNNGNDILNGEEGNDSINGSNGKDSISGGTGDDGIRGGANDDTIFGEDGVDGINGEDGNDNIWAGNDIDIIVGGNGNDIIFGGGGNDLITGGFGNDTINGDADNDNISGNEGNDTINGGLGIDTLNGNDGDDSLNGEGDGDTINGGNGNDTIFGGDGDDFLFGNANNDRIRGGNGNDSINGGDGLDLLRGGDGYDTIRGGLGNDTINGDGGIDTLFGDEGDDWLVAIDDQYFDSMTGDAGRDIFWHDKDPRPAPDGLGGDILNDLMEEDADQAVIAFANAGTDRILNGDRIPGPAFPATLASKSFSANPLFSSAGPKATDIRQGVVSDCKVVSALGAMARDNGPGNSWAIRKNMVDFGDGTFGVNLGGQFYRVDNVLPLKGASTTQPNYATLGPEDSIWVAIAEKAIALADPRTPGVFNYADLASTGADEVFQFFGSTQTGVPYLSVPRIGGYPNAAALGADILQRFTAPQPQYLTISFADSGDEIQANPSLGIARRPGTLGRKFIVNHAYTVWSLNLNAQGQLASVVLRNPWGTDKGSSTVSYNDGNPNDALVTVTLAELFRSKGRLNWGTRVV